MDRRGRILFTDISVPEFSTEGLSVSFKDLMDRIHGRLPDGTLVEGPEVFRRLYTAVGLGYLVAWTRLPGISWVVERAYALFAKHRLRFTGRCHDGYCEPV